MVMGVMIRYNVVGAHQADPGKWNREVTQTIMHHQGGIYRELTVPREEMQVTGWLMELRIITTHQGTGGTVVNR
jgi:hypothetical protein